MNVLNRGIIALAAVLCVATTAVAQQPQPGPFGRGQGPRGRFGGPPRDNAPAAKGSARISGRVISAETGAPIRRAQVRVTSRDARTSRDAATDVNGRFEILSLPAGRYTLHVSKAGYVALEYGQARPFETGKPIDIAEGQLLERMDFSLPRGSAITGRITDEFGDPVTDAQVRALRYQFTSGERRLVNAGRIASTDDLGQFRIFGLMPGDYLVRATLRPGVNRESRQGALTDDPGEATGYPGTYYPGVTDVTQAQTVSVSLGQEMSAIAFPLMPARLSRIAGTVMSSDGRPLNGAMVFLRGGGADDVEFNIPGGNQLARPDGSFTFVDVPPGDYRLEVQQRPQNLRNSQTPGQAPLEFVSVPLSVANDIEGLSIVTAPGASASGRVVFQGQSGQKSPITGMQVTAVPRTGQPSVAAFVTRVLGGRGTVGTDGSFELRGLFGPLMVRVNGVPSGWAIKSVTLDGADITDTPFEFKPGTNSAGLVITLTDRITEISGQVRDARGQPATDYVLVVFAEDSKLWGAQSRYVATTRPNQNGTFTIKALPPGRYLAAVVPALENGMQNDVQLLAQLRAKANSFSLAEGQTQNLNLDMPAQ